MGWCITERVKRLAGNEIELGIEIPTIESWASNIPVTKETMYVVIAFFMTYTCSYDYGIMQLPNTGGTLSVLPNVTT